MKSTINELESSSINSSFGHYYISLGAMIAGSDVCAAAVSPSNAAANIDNIDLLCFRGQERGLQGR